MTLTSAYDLTTHERLRRRQRAHDLRAGGAKLHEIRDALHPVSRTTISEWLAYPRPTDEEIDEAEQRHRDLAGDRGTVVGLKTRVPTSLFERSQREAEAQGVSMSRLTGCAVALYVDCMERIRQGRQDPVNLLGYRP